MADKTKDIFIDEKDGGIGGTTLRMPAIKLPEHPIDLIVQTDDEMVPLDLRNDETGPLADAIENYVKGPERIHVDRMPPEEFEGMKGELEGQGYIYMGKHSKDEQSYVLLLNTREENLRNMRDDRADLSPYQKTILREANRMEIEGHPEFVNKIQEECWKYRQKRYDLVTITIDNQREIEFKAVHLFYRKPKK